MWCGTHHRVGQTKSYMQQPQRNKQFLEEILGKLIFTFSLLIFISFLFVIFLNILYSLVFFSFTLYILVIVFCKQLCFLRVLLNKHFSHCYKLFSE